MIAERVTAAADGMHSIRVECARRVSISGLRRNASSVTAGRRIQNGTRAHKGISNAVRVKKGFVTLPQKSDTTSALNRHRVPSKRRS